MSQRIKDFMTIFILQLVISLPIYTASVYGLTISNVKVTRVSTGSATIEWDTDEQANSTINYGKTNTLGLSQKESSFVKKHSITLSKNMEQDTEYFFSVESSLKSGETKVDSKSNQFYKFKTEAEKQSTATEAAKTAKEQASLLEVTLPQFHNKRSIDIIGTTKPFATVTLYVNNFDIPKRRLSGNEVASGRFVFAQVALEESNLIKIVAEEQSITAEKTFEVFVDDASPVVKLNKIEELTSKPNFTISGNVNEKVEVKVYIDSAADKAAEPAKITGLNTSKVSQNSVELKWTESRDKDFSHYVVYRADVGPIALTSPANYNLYNDVLVDSDKEYRYEVSAVDIFGNEGPKSDPLVVKTLPGGVVLNIKPDPVDVIREFRKPTFTVNASGDFNFVVRLNKGDGSYNVKMIFEDKAGNTFVSEKLIILDTKKPTVKITTPPQGALIFENVANNVNVAGKTKPNARVHLFVDRTPFDSFQQSVEVTGLPNEAQNVPKSDVEIDLKNFDERIAKVLEKELESKCKGITKGLCSQGADRSVTADAQGNFRFDNVDLTASVGLAGRLREVPLTEFRDTLLNREGREAKKANLLVIATDQFGQRGFAKSTVNIGTCWSGNQSWDIIPLTGRQSPTFLSTERMAEGTETLYFFFNYSYIGRGSNAKIKSVSLARACGNRESVDPRFNISCRILPPGDMATKINPDGTLTYSAVPLNRFEGMETFAKGDWKSFFEALGVNKDMTFPFKVRILYEHDVIDDTGMSRKMLETQTACQEVSYVVDNTLIDPRKVLPDFLLYDFVSFLQKSIETLTKVQEQIERVINYVAVGCLYSFFAHLIFKIYRNWIDITSEKLLILNKYVFNTGNSQTDRECKELIDAVRKANSGNMKLSFISDPDLKKCFPSSYAAWNREANIYQWQRWSCDRIFGHSSPSRWTEDRSDDELVKKITTPKTCAGDGNERGQVLTAVPCAAIEGRWNTQGVRIHYFDNQPPGQMCFEVQSNPKTPQDYYVYTIYEDRQEASLLDYGIYKLTLYEGRLTTAGTIYALKQSENQYMTYQPKTCRELCGIQAADQTYKIEDIDGEAYEVKEGKIVPAGQKPKPGEDVTSLAACVTVNQCRKWYNKARETDPAKNGIPFKDKILTGYSIETKGYASNCFYQGPPQSPAVLDRTNSDTREVCCCINGKTKPNKEIYFQPDDTDKVTGKPIHETKKDQSGQSLSLGKDDYANMEWSYRYWRIGYLGKKYNPNRYIEGRDKPACFGQDSLFYKLFRKDVEEVLVLNPFKSNSDALQCVYLTGVNQRLQMYKNIMAAMSNCLIEVRSTGRADAGVCKELFTQHVCGLIWQAVRFFTDGCSSDDPYIDFDAQDDNIADKLKIGFQGIAKGISEAQSEMAEEYGNVKLNNLLGVGQGGVARKVCLAAFGYDWDLTARNLVDAAYTTPFATLVQPITRSREFLTVDPITLRPKYEYRASWIINPGCDLNNYKVELVCVTKREQDQYPNSINCGAIGAGSFFNTGQAPLVGEASTGYNQCDCLFATNPPQPFLLVNENNIKQNKLIDRDVHKVVEMPYRYDHIKFTLVPDRRIVANVQKNCFPQGYEQGVFYRPITDKTARDIADCTVDPLSGVFKCSGGADFFGGKGTVQLLEVTINGDNPEKVQNREFLEYPVGTELKIGARVTKTGKDKCFRVSLSPDIIEPPVAGITVDGTSDVPPLLITDRLSISGRIGNIVSGAVTVKLRLQNNQDPVVINTEFVDNKDNPDKKEYVGVFSPDDRIIIDGHKVDLRAGQVTPETNPNPETKISIEGRTDGGSVIVVRKLDAELEITGASYSAPLREGEPYQLKQQIQIFPAQQATTASQEKTVLIEIFNIKSDRESFNNIGDCNFQDRMLEKTYKIKITEQGVDVSKLGATIQPPVIRPSVQIQGQPIVISARVFHRGGLPFDRPTITITDPKGINVVDNIEMLKIDDSVGWQYTFDTAGQELGRYSGNIKVINQKGVDPSSKSFTLEIKPKAQAAPTTPSVQGAAAAPTIPATSISATKANLMGLGSINGIRQDVQQAFDLMKEAALRNGVSLNIVSGYRSFNEQLQIWNNKFNSFSGSEQEKITKTAQYSAVPGLSRHHFGTEIDINSVDPADFASNGRYSSSYTWLKNNAARYEFCQPYDTDKVLVKAEPWHWSYKPISQQLTTQHMSTINKADLVGKNILGENTIISNFDFYHNGFVNNINSECLA